MQDNILINYFRQFIYFMWVLDQLNKYGICQNSKMKDPLLKEIGDHFIDSTVELVKKAHRFVFVLDNMDWTVKVSEL